MSCIRYKEMFPSLSVEQKSPPMVTNQIDYRSLVDCACTDTHRILLDMAGRVTMGIYTRLLIRKAVYLFVSTKTISYNLG
jgi:hypothetical protein